MKTQLIALNKLELSPLNVRKTTSKTADAELMANIKALGLINPPTVTEQKGGRKRHRSLARTEREEEKNDGEKNSIVKIQED